jgi:putative integral membrane protein (TIGR02587 family)
MASGASPPSTPAGNGGHRHLVRGLSRAFGGAIVFALPVFMTMEMWELGMHMDRLRLVLLLLINVPILVFLSHYAGFERTFEWQDDLRDAAIAYGVGILAAGVLLTVFGVIGTGRSLDEIVGKVAVQAVPASLGALLARSTFGGNSRRREGDESYFGELCLMAVGALFLGFNTAPTEEIVLISYKMTPWHAVILVVLSVALMHAFVFASAFRGGSHRSPRTPWWSAFIRFTVVGYVIAVMISAYVLWTYGSLAGHELRGGLMVIVVLAFPAAIGAAAARLIL